MSATATKPVYVYGVTAQRQVPRGPGIAGTELQLIGDDELSAIVSELPPGEEPTLGRDELAAHAAVLEQAMKLGPVLPMRFGVVMQRADAVRGSLLSPHRSALSDQLSYLTGKVELRLRASYDEDTLLREVLAQEPEVAQLQQAIRGRSPDAGYYDRIRLGELVATAIQQRRERDAEQLLAALTPFSVDILVSDPPHERVALQTSILAEESRLAELDQVVEGLGAAHHPRLRLKFTGPLPPYSFVDLEHT